jgi:hypothetical protein
VLLIAVSLTAQEPMPEHHASAGQGMQMNAAGMSVMNQTSGTSVNPAAWPMPMVMSRLGTWNLMWMGQFYAMDTQQSGLRGGDKFYSTNWLMVAAEHSLAGGSFMVQGMFSLEPATVTGRRYPELFQTGETAFGVPIVDGQHPHNFVMGLGFNYVHRLAAQTMIQLYYAPVGDPALGPVAYPHRASAAELPEAALGHHWQDSTHIANNVVTVGVKRGTVRLEGSGFYGTEPGENRWTIGHGPMNSWSTRLSWSPSRNWLAQVSGGRLTQPERQEAGDVIRTTASLHYSKPMGGPMTGSSWSSSVIWGRNHDTATQHNLNSFLAESVLPIRRKNFVTGRFELVDKDELFSNDPTLEARVAQAAGSTFRIGAYTAGYTRDVPSPLRLMETGVGANVTFYTTPVAIKPYYGQHPMGVSVFLRLRLRPETKSRP